MQLIQGRYWQFHSLSSVLADRHCDVEVKISRTAAARAHASSKVRNIEVPHSRVVRTGRFLRWPGDQVNKSCSSIGQMTWVEGFQTSALRVFKLRSSSHVPCAASLVRHCTICRCADMASSADVDSWKALGGKVDQSKYIAPTGE